MLVRQRLRKERQGPRRHENKQSFTSFFDITMSFRHAPQQVGVAASHVTDNGCFAVCASLPLVRFRYGVEIRESTGTSLL